MNNHDKSKKIEGRKGTFIFYLLSFIFLWPLPVSGLDQWTIGGRGHRWQDWGELKALEITPQGQIRPEYTHPEENLSLRAEARGGGVSTPVPALKATTLPGNRLSNMIDGDRDKAFQCEMMNPQGAFFVLDLGASLGVNRIVFYPRESKGDKEFPFLMGYRLSINDGKPESVERGVLEWTVVARKALNTTPRVEVNIPLQFVRYIRLESITTLTWEIAELEVYGEGYAPKISYTSNVIDMTGAANWGKLRWSHRSDPGASMALAVRTGKTPDPYRYFKIVVDEITQERTLEPIPKAEYEKLAESDRSIDLDWDNWSDWSDPFALTGEEQITSPAPRRYIQFKIEVESSVFSATTTIDSLSIEYSLPPVAREIAGVISPRRVPGGEPIRFTYSLKVDMDPKAGHTGFDGLEITTLAQPTFRALAINGASINLPVGNMAEQPDRLVLRFPDHRVEKDGTTLQIVFECPVFVYGTIFEGRVFDTTSDELPQYIVPDLEMDPRALSVEVGLGTDLLASVQASPTPFSPNGDGRNDETTIGYTVLKVTELVPISVEIYSLSGGSVKTLYSGQGENGRYQHRWDGKDDQGEWVSPGVYICQVSVQAVDTTARRSTAVTVIY